MCHSQDLQLFLILIALLSFFVVFFSHLPVLQILSPFVEELRNVTLVFICNMGKGQEEEFCKGLLDHSVNKSTTVRSWPKMEQNQEADWCLTFAHLYQSTLSTYRVCVHKHPYVTKDKCYQKNDKSSAFLQITLDIC